MEDRRRDKADSAARAEEAEAASYLRGLHRARVVREENVAQAEKAEAATKLQSMYRGRVARKDTARRKADLAAKEQELAEVEKAAKEAEAAALLQATFRGGAARRGLVTEERELASRSVKPNSEWFSTCLLQSTLFARPQKLPRLYVWYP